MTRMHHLPLSIIVLLLVFFFPNQLIASEKTITGRLELPPGVNEQSIQLLLHTSEITENESDWDAPEKRSLNDNGSFDLTWDSDVYTQLEVTGPSIRRSRFDLDALAEKGSRVVLKLEPGRTLRGQLVDVDGNPVIGALIGPILPGVQYSSYETAKAYPFFVLSDENGGVEIPGILPLPKSTSEPATYILPVYAKGYQRTRRSVAAEGDFTITMKPGGQYLSGTVVEEGTRTPVPDIPILLSGGPGDLHVERRSEEDGGFRFDGLTPGDYTLSPYVEGVNIARTSEFTVVPTSGIDKIILPIRRGIRISGNVVDVETGIGLPDVPMELGEIFERGDQYGRFEFNKVTGPWPATLNIDYPGWEFLPEDQDSGDYPFNGFDGNHISEVTINLRRLRFLELLIGGIERQTIPGMLELWGPLEDSKEIERHRISSANEVKKLPSGGTRIAFVRLSDDRVSDLIEIYTADDQTTTTLAVEPKQPARLEGKLSWKEERENSKAPAYTAEIVYETVEGPIVISEANSSSKGTVTFDLLPPGDFTVNFLRPEGAPYFTREVTLQRGETLRLEESVSKGHVVAGRVIDEEGEGLRDIQISFYGSTPEGDSLHLKDTTGEGGSFEVQGFGGDTLREIRISHRQYADLAMDNVSIPNSELEIILEKRQGIVVTIDGNASGARAMTLVARQRSAAQGLMQDFYETDESEPFAGESSVTVVPQSTGMMRVAVNAGQQWAVSEPFAWTAASKEKELTLSPGETGSLRVTMGGLYENEEPDVVLVNTTLPSGAIKGDIPPTSVEGNIAIFDGLIPGTYFLLGSTEQGGSAALNNVEISAGQSAQVALEFTGIDGAIAGTVSYDGELTSGVSIKVYFAEQAQPEILMEETTGSDGSFLLEPLPTSRRYLLEASYNGVEEMVMVSSEQVQSQAPVAISLQSAVDVSLAIPGDLESLWSQQPQIPLLFQPITGSVLATLTYDQARGEVALTPGQYTVSLGEQRLGQVTIPSEGGPVQLPDLP